MVDTDPKSVKYHLDNTIILDKWTGDIHDKTLWDLVPLLVSKFIVKYSVVLNANLVRCKGGEGGEREKIIKEIISINLIISLHVYTSLSLSLSLSLLFFQHPAIAASQVDDIRPVLNNFKSEGDGKNILETFKIRRAQLQAAEEERQREAMARRSSHIGGFVPTFRLGFGHRSEQPPPPPSPAAGAPTGEPGSDTGSLETRDIDHSQSDQSWVQWIGSWIGWK